MTNNNMYFVANWKMHGNTRYIESSKSIIKLSKQKKYKNHKIIYCPPYTLINHFHKKVKKSKILIGAQDCHEILNFGPYTGSINAKLIKSAGAKFVILGHSEKRKDGDTDKVINAKIKSALVENLKIIFCVGETLLQKRKKLTYSVLKKQINLGLKDIKKFANIIIAYEPVWSIGTGLLPKNEDLKKNLNDIKNILKKLKNKKNSEVKIIYGGSVTPKNVKNLVEIKEINGFIIGGASLNSKKFIDILKKSTI